MPDLFCTVCRGGDLKSVTLSPEQEACRNNVPEELPYLACLRCGLWIQMPIPFQSETEDEASKRKEVMLSEHGHYEWLAERLVGRYKPNSVLDIGSNYPMLLNYFKTKHDVDDVFGIDTCKNILEYGTELNVPVVHEDFMKCDIKRKFDIVTPGISAGYWNDKNNPSLDLLSGDACVISSPSKIIFPDKMEYLGCPIKAFAKVDLPEPLGPIRAWTSPGLICKETPFTISLPSTAIWISWISSMISSPILRFAPSLRRAMHISVVHD